MRNYKQTIKEKIEMTKQEIKTEIRNLNCDYAYYEMKFLKEIDEEMESDYYESMYQIGEQIVYLSGQV